MNVFGALMMRNFFEKSRGGAVDALALLDFGGLIVTGNSKVDSQKIPTRFQSSDTHRFPDSNAARACGPTVVVAYGLQ